MENVELVLCKAILYHGNGHQSKTKCRVKGIHTIHNAIYGHDYEEMSWVGDEACTGFFNEPLSLKQQEEYKRM
ncbi:hypothetical protein HN682_09930 [Candidatus Peregrinibacteria bacterium]|jgi:hypothetical protein|nr:hypothetical protein [Candidatus Peregrinibacteria bacterium]